MDASFWVYLVHIPTVVIFQALIVPLEAPWPFKLLVVIVCSGIVCLASYRWLIQGTRLDRFLNGSKTPSTRNMKAV